MGFGVRRDDVGAYGLYGVLTMVSLRFFCARSALAAALPRCTSRFLRQATYSDEPTATLLARQIASSSSPRLETGTSLREAQAESVSAANVSMIQRLITCIHLPHHLMVRSPRSARLEPWRSKHLTFIL